LRREIDLLLAPANDVVRLRGRCPQVEHDVEAVRKRRRRGVRPAASAVLRDVLIAIVTLLTTTGEDRPSVVSMDVPIV
tara:strand:+ start:167 stop:400 length:234 start_codon:yes stop_codon:yes gene_type:complete